MGFWKQLFGKSDGGPPTGLGVIASFDEKIGQGVIRLDSARELTFATSALKGVTAAAGVRVNVFRSEGTTALDVLPGPVATPTGVMPPLPSREEIEASAAAASARAAEVRAKLDAEDRYHRELQEEGARNVPGETPAARLQRVLAKSQLDDRLRAEAVRIALPGARLITSNAGPAKSHLGGRPHLPADRPWPSRNGQPMSLLAEIALDEVPDSVRAFLHLPAAGTLAFFVGSSGIESLDVQRESEACAVIHAPAGSPLTDPPSGLPKEWDWPHRPVRLQEELRLPYAWDERWAFDDASDPEESREHAEDVRYALGEPGPDHLLGGFANDIQDLMYGDDEKLLLQIDSERTGWMWGDSGRLYFHASEDELAEHRFEAVRLTMQYY